MSDDVHACVSVQLPIESIRNELDQSPSDYPSHRMSIDEMHEYIYKTAAELAAERGLTLEELKAQAAARVPRNRGKNI